MRIESVLPPDRLKPGTITAYGDDGSVLYGPAPAYGKADNLLAASHRNPKRDPVLPGGDHPYGEYLVMNVQFNKFPPRSYGLAFMLLDPQKGDAYLAKDNGRAGLGIHGGDLTGAGALRPTEGCLRVTNEASLVIAGFVRPALIAGHQVVYVCSRPPAPEPAKEES